MSDTHTNNDFLDPIQARFEKKRADLKRYCLGHGYHMVLSAIALAEKYHTGVRKDGFTPEFEHQLDIALYCTTLKDVLNEEYLLAVVILHDLKEDYGDKVSDAEIEAIVGPELAHSVSLMNKFKPNGKQKSKKEYYGAISQDPWASIAKGADRIHNMQSMRGVFSNEKQARYVRDVESYILPMLRTASEFFPEQRLAYRNVELVLETQMEWINVAHENARAVVVSSDNKSTPDEIDPSAIGL